ncbi:hypothetical protein BRC68_09250 [Halobacteriales archaeon QH_6_64_20]|nr:MAG: hypothetical protein BRC68_09250 [Halobacteriales archaeon QH_6_64_20]
MDAATIAMTHEGESDGIPPTERDAEVRGTTDCHIADGEAQEHRVRFDQRRSLGRLGLTDTQAVSRRRRRPAGRST